MGGQVAGRHPPPPMRVPSVGETNGGVLVSPHANERTSAKAHLGLFGNKDLRMKKKALGFCSPLKRKTEQQESSWLWKMRISTGKLELHPYTEWLDLGSLRSTARVV